MTPQELHDKWVDPYRHLRPGDKAIELFIKDVEEMNGTGVMTFTELFERSAHLFNDGQSAYYKSAMQAMDELVKKAKDDRIPI